MTATEILEVALNLAYPILVAIAAVDYIRGPSPVRLAVVSVFASVALVYTSGAVGRIWPEVAGPAAVVGVLALVALPFLTFRLVGHFRRQSASIDRLVTIVFVAFAALTVVIGAGADLGLGEIGNIVVLLGLLAYFVIVEAASAVMIGLEARRRAGASRTRLLIAAGSTALLSAAVLVLGAGGLATLGNPDAQDTISILVQLLSLGAALGYLAALLPPRWLRQMSQQAIGYRFVRDLQQLPTGSPVERIWELLEETARAATGAVQATVRVDRVHDSAGEPATAEPTAARGSHRPWRDQRLSIPMSFTGPDTGALELIIPGSPLFMADDVELLTILARVAGQAANREQTLRERERLIAALEAASAAKSDFLASMSHELRTPLNAIMGFSSLMAAQDDVDGALTVPREWIEHIRTGGDHLLGLINDLLVLAKVEAGRLELTIEPVDVGHAIAASVAGLRPLADRKHQKVEVVVEPSIVIDADPGRLRQILYNLLSNSIKYTPDGGSIRVSGLRVGTEVWIAVEDSGVGIAAGDQARVFEEFRQVGDPSQRQSGTGLGLALTKRLVEAHGGRIDLQSELGSGSTFTVSLKDRPASVATSETSSAPTVGPADPEGGGILVIEDEPSSARLLQTYLADAGYRVRIAPDGETGIAMGRSARPAAIVLDILLPGIDGWEVLRQLKSDPALRDVPVIIATVVDERGVGLALGAVDYLVKPVDPEALLDRLGRYTFTTKVKTRGMSVLAIDDDPAALDVIASTLAPLGFTVRRASSGREGIELARRHGADLIICDLMMADLDGFEVVARLQDVAATASIPILVLTSHDLSSADKARLNGRVLGIATKGDRGVDGLSEWLVRVLSSESSSPAPEDPE
jgi:signal transduction histidine kinase/CheY-like chemotaxis protein